MDVTCAGCTPTAPKDFSMRVPASPTMLVRNEPASSIPAKASNSPAVCITCGPGLGPLPQYQSSQSSVAEMIAEPIGPSVPSGRRETMSLSPAATTKRAEAGLQGLGSGSARSEWVFIRWVTGRRDRDRRYPGKGCSEGPGPVRPKCQDTAVSCVA